MKYLLTVVVWASVAMAQVVPDLYIVELKGEPAAAALARGRRAALDAHRTAVHREQALVRQSLTRLHATVVSAVDVVANALIVRIPDADAARLAELPGVAHVYPVVTCKAHLNEAVPLHKAPEVWQALGGVGNAGAGIKVGIIDSGIDVSHPAFQDATLTAPAGFPKLGAGIAPSFTNGKVIVARNYSDDFDATDNSGHGTGVAMTIAGGATTAPRATITGMAPKAWLGNYKVGSSAPSSALLEALNQAVLDGMDVVNISMGSVPAMRPSQDALVLGVGRAVEAGVVVVISAGNEGSSRYTIGSPGSAPTAISVGAHRNRRMTWGSPVEVAGVPPYPSYPGISSVSLAAVSAPLFDVALLDPTGLACDPLPANSLRGQIALVLRGTCNFTVKEANVAAAGAVAIIVYLNATAPDLSTFAAGYWDTNALPATMIGYADGLDLKARLLATPGFTASINFPGYIGIVWAPNVLASFTSRGPNPDMAIKPDLVAAGMAIYTAAPGASFTQYNGTSFSAPLTTGAVALLRQAKPGLTANQYRSLIINSAKPFEMDPELAPVQLAGAGMLDVSTAVNGTVAANPVSISFGAGGGTVDQAREVELTNVGSTADTFQLWMKPLVGQKIPAGSVYLRPGASQRVQLRFSATDLGVGEYQGFLVARGSTSSVEARIPYWYAVKSAPASIVLLSQSLILGRARQAKQSAFMFAVLDASGVPLTDVQPTVTATTGASATITTLDATYPGVWGGNVVLGPTEGTNVFHIQVGDLAADVNIRVFAN